MKIILRPRGMGKTTDLIKIASKGRYKLIVCSNRSQVDWIWRRALEMRENKEIDNLPPQPITFDEFNGDSYVGRNIESVLIDNAELYLQSLTNVRIEAITMSEEDTRDTNENQI